MSKQSQRVQKPLRLLTWNIWRFVRSLTATSVADFVRHMQMVLDVAEVVSDGVVEDQKAFEDENVQQLVVLDDLFEVVVLVVVEHQLVASSEWPRFVLLLIAIEVIVEQILVLRTRHQRARARVVQNELFAEDFHHIVDHFVHVDGLENLPVQVV